MLEKSFYIVMIVYAIVSFIVFGLSFTTVMYGDKKEKSSKRKTQIEIGKSVNDRFEEIEISLQRIETAMKDYSIAMKAVQSCTDKTRANVEKLN